MNFELVAPNRGPYRQDRVSFQQEVAIGKSFSQIFLLACWFLISTILLILAPIGAREPAWKEVSSFTHVRLFLFEGSSFLFVSTGLFSLAILGVCQGWVHNVPSETLYVGDLLKGWESTLLADMDKFYVWVQSEVKLPSSGYSTGEGAVVSNLDICTVQSVNCR